MISSFQNSNQVDARNSNYHAVRGDVHYIIINPQINVTNHGPGTDMFNLNPPSHISSSERSATGTTISPPPTLPKIITTFPETSGSAPRLSSHSNSQSEYSPITNTSSASMPSSTHKLAESIEQQFSQFKGNDDSIQGVTLEALINQLIADFSHVGRAQGIEYRDTFFTTCTAFTTHNEVFESLVLRYRAAEASSPQHRIHLRINLITAMKYWVTNPQLAVDINVVARMQEFASSIGSSRPMEALATELYSATIQRLRPPSESPSIARPETPDPKSLAIALAMLEGDKYAGILPGDYISYLRNPGANDNIQAAYNTNNQIIDWVTSSILHNENLNKRCDVLIFFVNTAQESLKLCNFASMSAIVTALRSPTITRLCLTYDRSPRDVKHNLERMGKLLDSSHNYHAYKAVLKNSCIPWLDAHIHDMRIEFSKGTDMVEIHMINFAKWTRVHNYLKDILRRKPPDVSKYRQKKAGVLAYLEGQLCGTAAIPNMNQYLEKLSSRLEQQEALKRQQKIGGLLAAGMA